MARNLNWDDTRNLNMVGDVRMDACMREALHAYTLRLAGQPGETKLDC